MFISDLNFILYVCRQFSLYPPRDRCALSAEETVAATSLSASTIVLLERYRIHEEENAHGVRSDTMRKHYKQLARQQKKERKQDRLISRQRAKKDD